MDVVRRMSFPKKINYILSQDYPCIEQCGPDGFRVLDEEQFETMVLQRFFKTSRMTSFKRQLNIYGFTRILDGPRANAHCHPDFIVGDYDRVGTIQRAKKRPGTAADHASRGTKRPNLDTVCSGDERECPSGAFQTGFKRYKPRSSTRELLERSRFCYKERTYAELLADHQRRQASGLQRSKCMAPADADPARAADGHMGLVPPPPIITCMEEESTDYGAETPPRDNSSAWCSQFDAHEAEVVVDRPAGEKLVITPTAFDRSTSFTAQLDALERSTSMSLDLDEPLVLDRDHSLAFSPLDEGIEDPAAELISGFRRQAPACSDFYLFGAE